MSQICVTKICHILCHQIISPKCVTKRRVIEICNISGDIVREIIKDEAKNKSVLIQVVYQCMTIMSAQQTLMYLLNDCII